MKPIIVAFVLAFVVGLIATALYASLVPGATVLVVPIQRTDLGSGVTFQRTYVGDRGCVDLFIVQSWTGSIAVSGGEPFRCESPTTSGPLTH